MKYYLAAAPLIVICVAPVLVAYSQTGDLVRTKLGSGTTYSVEQLKPGNPIDFLAVSLPGFGMSWMNKDQDWNWMLGPVQSGQHAGYNYMGIPTLALAIFGMICGKMATRRRLLFILLFFGGVVCLSGSGPFMATLLSVPSPLRSNDHFSDVVFRVGGFLFFVLGAANGLHGLIHGGKGARMLFTAIFIVLFLIMLRIFVAMVGAQSTGNQSIGFFALMGLIYAALFLALCRANTRRTAVGIVGGVVLVLFIDVVTISYLQLKIYWPAATVVDETPAQDNIGLKTMRPDYYTENLISYGSLLDLLRAGINPGAIPGLKGFAAAHQVDSLEAERALLVQAGSFDQYNSLGVKLTPDQAAGLSDFLKTNAPATSPTVQLTDFSRTYNRLTFGITTSDRCILFVRDAYSPYWTATVNGQPVAVYRALSNFKCVVMPQGASTLVFNFRPPEIYWLLPLALVVFWATMIYLGWQAAMMSLRRARPAPTKPQVQASS